MPIKITWDDTEPPSIDIELTLMVGPTGARSLRSWLHSQNLGVEAKEITLYLNSISDWRRKTRKDES